MQRRLVVSLACLLLLGGCWGDSRAEKLADTMADDIEVQWSFRSGYVRTGSELAAQAAPADQDAVQALSWEGTTGTRRGARVLLRITTHVDEDQQVFGSPASDAVRCYRFTVGDHDDLHELDRDLVRCPAGATPGSPTVPPETRLPDNIQDLMESMLRASDAASLERDAEASFGREFTVSTGVDGRRLVVAVGTRNHEECSVAMREADGEYAFPSGFPREWLLPGELGCSADLVLLTPR